jgi:hypothetical protein
MSPYKQMATVSSPTAIWLLNLFASPEAAEALLGDLHEEFTLLSSKYGSAFARRRFWLQLFSTIPHFAAAGLRIAPWSTTAIVAAGFYLQRFAFRLPHWAITTALDKYRIYETHPNAYIFWVPDGALIGRVILGVLLGAMVAFASKKREMTATLSLAMVQIALAVIGMLTVLFRFGDYQFLWTLPWVVAFSLATVAGGIIVRTRRISSPCGASGS